MIILKNRFSIKNNKKYSSFDSSLMENDLTSSDTCKSKDVILFIIKLFLWKVFNTNFCYTFHLNQIHKFLIEITLEKNNVLYFFTSIVHVIFEFINLWLIQSPVSLLISKNVRTIAMTKFANTNQWWINGDVTLTKIWHGW